MSRSKGVLFGAVLLGLLGILAIALVREAPTASRSTTLRRGEPLRAAPRPALTAAEESYAMALWPMHNEVKTSALKMTFGGLAYKLKEIDRATLKARVDAANETYRRAEVRIRKLEPPPSLQKLHAEYLDAVGLYEQSAAEMARVVKDGRDDHLVAAFPMSKEAGEKILRVGNTLWPGEYVPN